MKVPHTPDQAKQKIYRYCAYQERSHLEVKNKLFAMGIRSGEVNEILAHLIAEGFLNEERFARAFAGGRFRQKKWGRLRIIHELEMRGLTKNCIRLGLSEIDESDYFDVLKKLIRKKARELSGENVFVKRSKISKTLIHKGYEPDIVWAAIKELLPDK